MMTRTCQWALRLIPIMATMSVRILLTASGTSHDPSRCCQWSVTVGSLPLASARIMILVLALPSSDLHSCDSEHI
jgi:hypothetical protein